MADPDGRITLWGIEVFLAAAEEGAISAAARRLGASPSAISQQLSGLETALGAALLDRTARPMRVTPAGAMFRKHAQSIVNSAAEARSELAFASSSGLTTLRLGMIEDFDAEVTPRLLTSLSNAWRSCRFLLETGASHSLLDQLDARALDMVVAADTGTELAADANLIEVHPLLVEPFVAVAPLGAVLPGADIAHQLQALPLIQYSARHHMGRLISTHLARQNLRLAHRFELDSYSAILAMVAAGTGWTILTPLAVQAAKPFHPAIDVMPLPLAPLERRISLYARAGILQDMPANVAANLRELLQTSVIAPSLAAMPWLKDNLRVL